MASPGWRQTREDPAEAGDGGRRAEGLVTVGGFALAIVGLLFSVLASTASLALAALGVGLVVGLVAGVLLTPAVRRTAAWLCDYLKQ